MALALAISSGASGTASAWSVGTFSRTPSASTQRYATCPTACLGGSLATVITFAFVTIGWAFFFLSPGDVVILAARVFDWRATSLHALVVPSMVFVGLLLAHLSLDPLRAWWSRIPPIVRLSGRTVMLGALTYALFLASGVRQGFFYAQF
jgi:hypothetical protein